MSSNIDSQKPQSARKVGNIFLQWKIHNYSLTSAKPYCKILSPVLYVRGPRTTIWQLTLWPYLEASAERQFVFLLNRLDNDSTDVILIDWKIALMTNAESLICAKTGQNFFKGSSWFQQVVSNDAESIFERLHRLISDTLLVYFQVIITHREANNSFEVTFDPGLKSLSRDLFALYKRGRFSDVTIRIGNNSVRAHKAILQCRSPYFKDFIEQYRNEDVLDIEEFSYRTVNNMLSYLYSGKLEFVLGKPTIEMYECAVRFRIAEVIQYYALDVFPLESTIDVSEMYDVWNIPNFKTRSEDIMIKSHTFRETVSNLSVLFGLCPKGTDGKCNSVDVFAEFHGDAEKQYIFCLQLAIINRNSELVSIAKGTKVVKDSLILDFCDWPYKLVNSNLFLNDTLSIAIKLQVCDIKESWYNFGTPSLYPFSSPNDIEHSYRRLSNDIKSLISGSFSDITFVSECNDFELHKCILSARSHTFHKQITEWKPVYLSCGTMKVKYHIIGILMDYIYGGILNNCNLNDAMELYDVADEYLIPIFKVAASRFLRKSLTVKNVSDFLLFADTKRDTELKASAVKLISLNFSAVLAQENFRQLKTSHRYLYGEACELSTRSSSCFTPTKPSKIF